MLGNRIFLARHIRIGRTLTKWITDHTTSEHLLTPIHIAIDYCFHELCPLSILEDAGYQHSTGGVVNTSVHSARDPLSCPTYNTMQRWAILHCKFFFTIIGEYYYTKSTHFWSRVGMHLGCSYQIKVMELELHASCRFKKSRVYSPRNQTFEAIIYCPWNQTEMHHEADLWSDFALVMSRSESTLLNGTTWSS